jgi:hypothetical protein
MAAKRRRIRKRNEGWIPGFNQFQNVPEKFNDRARPQRKGILKDSELEKGV